MAKAAELRGALSRLDRYKRSKAPQVGMFSTLDELIENAPMEKAPLDQWINYLKPGRAIKREGIDFALKKEELGFLTSALDRLRAEQEHLVKMGETATGVKGEFSDTYNRDDLLQLLQSERPEFNVKLGTDNARLSANPRGTHEEASQLADEFTLEGAEDRVEYTGTQWGDYENLRLAHTGPDVLYEESVTGVKGLNFPGHFDNDALSWSRVTNHVMGDVGDVGTGPGALGRRMQRSNVRLIEEIQSDINKRGRDVGYEGDPDYYEDLPEIFLSDDPASKNPDWRYTLWSKAGDDSTTPGKMTRWGAGKSPEDAITKYQESTTHSQRTALGPDYHGRRSPEFKEQILAQEIYDDTKITSQLNRVPNVPLKDTREYARLEIRKQLLNAASQGQTHLAITTGAQQVQRYSQTGKAAEGTIHVYDKIYRSELEKVGKPYGAKIVELELPLVETIDSRPQYLIDTGVEDLDELVGHIVDFEGESTATDMAAQMEELLDVAHELNEEMKTLYVRAETTIPARIERDRGELNKLFDKLDGDIKRMEDVEYAIEQAKRANPGDPFIQELEARHQALYEVVAGNADAVAETLNPVVGAIESFKSSVPATLEHKTFPALELTPEINEKILKAGTPVFLEGGYVDTGLARLQGGGRVSRLGELLSGMDDMTRGLVQGKVTPKEPERIELRRQRGDVPDPTRGRGDRTILIGDDDPMPYPEQATKDANDLLFEEVGVSEDVLDRIELEAEDLGDGEWEITVVGDKADVDLVDELIKDWEEDAYFDPSGKDYPQRKQGGGRVARLGELLDEAPDITRALRTGEVNPPPEPETWIQTSFGMDAGDAEDVARDHLVDDLGIPPDLVDRLKAKWNDQGEELEPGEWEFDIGFEGTPEDIKIIEDAFEGKNFQGGGRVARLGEAISAMDPMTRGLIEGKVTPKEPERVELRRQRTPPEPKMRTWDQSAIGKTAEEAENDALEILHEFGVPEPILERLRVKSAKKVGDADYGEPDEFEWEIEFEGTDVDMEDMDKYWAKEDPEGYVDTGGFQEGGQVEPETQLQAIRAGVQSLPSFMPLLNLGMSGSTGPTERESRLRDLALQGFLSQWTGLDPEGRAAFGETPGIVAETAALPALPEMFGAPVGAPEFAREAMEETEQLRAALQSGLGIEEAEGFPEHFAESLGIMAGQVPVPTAWFNRMKQLGSLGPMVAKEAGNLAKSADVLRRATVAPALKILRPGIEWLSPVVEPRVTNYLIGALFGSTIGALTDEEVEEETGYPSIEELMKAAEVSEQAQARLLELLHKTQDKIDQFGDTSTLLTAEPEMGKGGKVTGLVEFLKRRLREEGLDPDDPSYLNAEGDPDIDEMRGQLGAHMEGREEVDELIRQMGLEDADPEEISRAIREQIEVSPGEPFHEDFDLLMNRYEDLMELHQSGTTDEGAIKKVIADLEKIDIVVDNPFEGHPAFKAARQEHATEKFTQMIEGAQEKMGVDDPKTKAQRLARRTGEPLKPGRARTSTELFYPVERIPGDFDAMADFEPPDALEHAREMLGFELEEAGYDPELAKQFEISMRPVFLESDSPTRNISHANAVYEVELEGPEEIIELLRGSEELQEKIVDALPRGDDGRILPEYQDQKDEPWHEYILRIKKKFEDEGIEFAKGGKVGSLISAMDSMDRGVATGEIIPKEPERISPRRQRTEEEPIDAFNYRTRSPHAQQIDGLLKRYERLNEQYEKGPEAYEDWIRAESERLGQSQREVEIRAEEEAAEILDELEDLDFDIDSIIFDS